MAKSMLLLGALFHVGVSGDYLRIECAKCNERCEFRFKGFDPAIPLAEVICPVHGSCGVYKVDGFDIGGSHISRSQFEDDSEQDGEIKF